MSRIMLLEDDLSLIDGLTYALKKQGLETDCVRTIEEAEKAWADGHYDLLILDVSLPDGSGFDLCRRVRESSDVPVLFLTARDDEIDVVMGLDIGGDDYVTKPFKLGILMSRVNALLRRSRNFSEEKDQLVSNGIKVIFARGQAYKNDSDLELTAVEYRLLCYFMQNPNTVLSKEMIYSRLWDSDGRFVDDNTLSVYIRRLRLKIEDDPEHPVKIVTVRGMGYKWNVTL